MNKEDTITRLLAQHFHKPIASVASARAAVEEAYEAGIREGYLQGQQSILENPKQAPVQPRSASVYVEAANTVVTVHGPNGDTYEVIIQKTPPTRETVYTISTEDVENIPFLVTKFACERVDVFQAICEQLAKL
jgi:hypothetical protein